jgi:S1-C subfamily serine protease
LIKLPTGTDYKPVTISRGTISLGENVTILGFAVEGDLTLVPGVVSALNESKANIGIIASVGPGQGGSPVFNRKGEVVAILLGGHADNHGAVAAPITFSKILLSLISGD